MSDTAAPKESLVMEHLVSLSYRDELAPNLARFATALMDGRLLAQKCPSCGRVYLPGKGFCPMCVVTIGESEELELPDTGTVTGFTIITPVAYYGQTETEPFVSASVLIDGADTPLGTQDIVNIPHEEIRTGLRVKARWLPKEKRTTEGMSNRGWGGVAGAIEAFEPNGEPDAPTASFEEHLF